jgi:integrase
MQAAVGGLYRDQGLVFASRTGSPLNPSHVVNRSFKPLLRQAALPNIRFHDLRHTCATLLLAKGIHPKIAQDRLGHATIAVTMNTYSHVTPHMQEQAATALDDALS